MESVTGFLNAVFQFVVGDWRLLIGVCAALVAVGALAVAAPAAAGLALLALVALTLGWSLQREAQR